MPDETAQSSKLPRIPGMQRSGPKAGTLPAVHRSLSTGALRQHSPARACNQSSSNKSLTPPLGPKATAWSNTGGFESRYKSTNSGASSSTSGKSSCRPTSADSPAAQELLVAEYETASAGALQAQVQLVQDAVGACQAVYAGALAHVNKCLQRIQQLEPQVQ